MEDPTKPEERAASRLPYPAPPEVWVKVSSAEATALDRLCSSTGQSPCEVAAILLAEYLVLDPAQAPLRATAEKLRSLHWERQRELEVQVSLTDPPKNPSRRVASKADCLRIPLSIRMNDKLYGWAVESGLTREEIARTLLRQPNLDGLAGQIEPAAGAIVEPAISNQTVS